MKRKITLLFAAFTFVLISADMMAQQGTVPEILYYKFDQTGSSVTNSASNPPVGAATGTIVGGQTQGSTGLCGGALIGTGGSGTVDYVSTGWNTTLGNSAWTIAFWINNLPNNTTLHYQFGDPGAASFRCFNNGVAGAGNFMLRGPVTDVTCTGCAPSGVPSMSTFVYDPTLGNIKAYHDGVLVNTVAQGVLNINGSGFSVGGTSGTGMGSGQLMDEFRFYDRALSATEVFDTYNACLPLVTAPNDAGISSILGFTPACIGTYPVQAVANNFGINAISGLTVGWSVNGVLQTPYTLTSTLDTLNGVGPNTQTVTLGNVTITDSTQIKVWTYLPNNVNDTVNDNDTTSMDILPMQVIPNLINGINCNGGSNGVAQASVIYNTGGTMTYSWSNGVNGGLLVGVQAGTYVLSGSNGTCTDTTSIVITHPPAIVHSDVTTGVSCFGDSTGTSTLTISGGTPGYTVSWAAGGTGLSNTSLPGGMNVFTITDANSCQVTDSVNVTQPTALNLTSTVTPETLGSDGAIDLTVSGGTPGYTYLWTNAATTQDLSGLNSGTFGVTVTDANGCTSTLSAVVNSVVGINEKSDDFGISIYPNPSNGHFTVVLTNGNKNASIEVFDVLGKKVYGIDNPNSTTEINLNVHNGVYLVKVMNAKNSYLERIVVKK